MVGSRLSEMLIDLGCEVAHLSRNPSKQAHFRTFRWDPDAGYIDDAAIAYPDFIVHLAGENLADGKWTKERKKEILESRVKSSELLCTYLGKKPNHVKAFISASGIGIYGDTGSKEVTENAKPAHDFLAEVCIQWEKAVNQISTLGIRTAIFRFGLVLSDEGGALPVMAKPVKLMTGAPLGNGSQYMSWIHIDDLCRLLIRAIEEPVFEGTFNAVAPNPVTNEEFTKTLGEVLHRPIILPQVPAFVLKLALGEKADMVLTGQKASADLVLEKGFRFEYPELRQALESFYGE